MIKVLVILGTRPEVIKLAPVIQALEAEDELFETATVASGQHDELLYPFLEGFGLRAKYDLRVMSKGQGPSQVCARILEGLDPVLVEEKPQILLVQGDTTTALAGALAAFHRRIPVGHVEAGLRSGDRLSPYPEEMNRILITRLATYHFAATSKNRDTLLREGVDGRSVFVTGNPVVDALQGILRRARPGPRVQALLSSTEGLRRIILTTHRRESFDGRLEANLQVLRAFVEKHAEVALIAPVHPNPVVRRAVAEILGSHSRIHLTDPLDYDSFIALLARCWLIVSDSGGVQEEAPTLGRPLLVLRDRTERSEALEAGVARLVGPEATRLAEMLEEAHEPGSWAWRASEVPNPFGQGDAGRRIAAVLASLENVLDASPSSSTHRVVP